MRILGCWQQFSNAMKYILATGLLLVTCSVMGQRPKNVSFDSLRQYSIAYEDSLIDIWGTGMNVHEFKTVNADIRISRIWGLTEMNFAEAKLIGDTLQIEFRGYPGHIFDTFRIIIVKDRFWSNYNFIDDHDFNSKMLSIATQLILSKSQFKKGEIIKGYTEYSGKCKNCKSGKTIDLKGSFKVMID